jgi:hypothetical protein
MIPGEREHAKQRRLGEGPIAVDRPTWKAMCAAAAGRIEIPTPLPG